MTLCLMVLAAPTRGEDGLAPIVKAYDEAVRAFVETSGQNGASIDLSKHPANETLPKVQAYAESNAGNPEAVPALVWMLKNARNAAGIPTGGKTAVAWAVERLRRDHVADPAIKDALPSMRYLSFQLGSEPLMRIYNAVADKNPDKATRALAWFNIAQTYFVSGNSAGPAHGGTETPRQKAKGILKMLVSDYADTPAAAEAAALLKATQGIGIGMEALDVAGPDVNGKTIQLSEYRGKVVCMVFWGSWCGPCMAMLPHEKEIVRKNAGKPFVMLGINSDQTVASLKKTMADKGVDWPVIWGGPASNHPIARAWEVTGWPTVVVLDHEGIVRYKNVRGQELERAIEDLIAKVPAKATPVSGDSLTYP